MILYPRICGTGLLPVNCGNCEVRARITLHWLVMVPSDVFKISLLYIPHYNGRCCTPDDQASRHMADRTWLDRYRNPKLNGNPTLLA